MRKSLSIEQHLLTQK